MEKAVAPHSSTLAWRVPWTEEPGRLQSMGSLRVRHDWVTSFSLFTFMHWRRKWQPTPVFLPGGSQGRGAWWAAVYGVTQSRTWLKWLSSSRGTNILIFIFKNNNKIEFSGIQEIVRSFLLLFYFFSNLALNNHHYSEASLQASAESGIFRCVNLGSKSRGIAHSSQSSFMSIVRTWDW